MDIITEQADEKVEQFVSFIKKNSQQWQLLDINLDRDSGLSARDMAKIVDKSFPHIHGKIFIPNPFEIKVLVNLGLNIETNLISKNIQKHIQAHQIELKNVSVSKEGLLNPQFLITKTGQDITVDFDHIRRNRKENVFFIVDDDLLIRKMFEATLSKSGVMHMYEEPSDLVQNYVQYVPDIVFLDIHLPFKSGPEILKDLKNLDPSAFVVILSSDSMKENVKGVYKNGAKGYINKPFTKDVIMSFAGRCPTVKNLVY